MGEGGRQARQRDLSAGLQVEDFTSEARSLELLCVPAGEEDLHPRRKALGRFGISWHSIDPDHPPLLGILDADHRPWRRWRSGALRIVGDRVDKEGVSVQILADGTDSLDGLIDAAKLATSPNRTRDQLRRGRRIFEEKARYPPSLLGLSETGNYL
jgi:hypothetical protein